MFPGWVNTRRRASHLGGEAREWWDSWFPFSVGHSQKASLIKWHCEQRSEGNKGTNYVHIWKKTIPEKGREFWDISKYKLANCVMSQTSNPSVQKALRQRAE